MTPASTLLLLRSGAAPLEVLMVKRSQSLFYGGSWVFPGGRVDPSDHDEASLALLDGVNDPDDGAWMLAAVRETAEEVGLCLTNPPLTGFKRGAVLESVRSAGVRFDGASIAYLSRWIAPDIVAKRFDTRFFVTRWPWAHEPVADGTEVTECEWVSPNQMLGRDHGEYPLVFPTIKHLELLADFDTPVSVVEHARGIEVTPIQPRPVTESGVLRLLLPGERGYEEAGVGGA